MESSKAIVEVFELIKHVGKGSRPFEEGSLVVNSNFILMCGILDTSTSTLQKFFALVVQNTSNQSYPHEVNVEIELLDVKKDIKVHCSCQGGEDGKCKHSVGVLLYLSRKTVSEIETLSCTDIRQQWGQIKQKVGEAYSAEPFETFCHGAPSHSKLTKTPSTSKAIFQILCKADTKSELSLHTQCSRSSSSSNKVSQMELPKRVLKILHLTASNASVAPEICNLNPLYAYKQIPTNEPCAIFRLLKNDLWKTHLKDFKMNFCTAKQALFYNLNVTVDQDAAREILVKTVTQNCPLWHAKRKPRITGSICYDLYTYMNNNHTDSDWEKKLHNVYLSTFKGNAHTYRGNMQESNAIQAYQQKTGLTIEKVGLVILFNTPWFGFSPDAISGGDILVEVKCPKNDGKLKADQLLRHQKYIKSSADGKFVLTPRHRYYGQIQMGLCLLNLRIAHLVIYEAENCSCDFIEVERDELFMQKLLTTLSTCYFKHLLPWLTIQHEKSESDKLEKTVSKK